MTRNTVDDDWMDDDAENPSDEDCSDESDDLDDSGDLLRCPACRREVHEDTQQCPHCGDWITPIHAESPWKRGVFIFAAVIAILGLLLVTTC